MVNLNHIFIWPYWPLFDLIWPCFKFKFLIIIKVIHSIMNFMFYWTLLLVAGSLTGLTMIPSGRILTLNFGSNLSNYMISKKSLTVLLAPLTKKHLMPIFVMLPMQSAFRERYHSDSKKAVNRPKKHVKISIKQNTMILLKWFLKFSLTMMKGNSPMIVPFSQLIVWLILDMSGSDSSWTFLSWITTHD